MFVRYAESRFLEYRDEMAYRFYVTDSIRALNMTIAQVLGGSYMQQRYFDVLNLKVCNKTETEIISAVQTALRKAVDDGTI